ncbi:MAG: hypothetical protein Q9220_004521 [cf. Caloplaca sp. 1 TL-2023]
MGKSSKQKLNRTTHHHYTKPSKYNNAPKAPAASSKKKKNTHPVPPPTIPFNPSDRILLVGEGDFSFAYSLYTRHSCRNLIATCYDDAKTLVEKYPQSTQYIRDLEGAALEAEEAVLKVIYSVDATNLGKGRAGGGKVVGKGGFEKVVFNFPHVGGLTKDVNRQVRYNQELLVNFFKAAIPLLAPTGSIIVTVFEGEPYSLWNIRDLARHVGLRVGRSFKFQAEAYPGYKHARTLGNIDGGGGWKGEQRDARTYIFERKDGDEAQPQQIRGQTRKKKKDEESDSDEDD